jgi:hypothetical protein
LSRFDQRSFVPGFEQTAVLVVTDTSGVTHGAPLKAKLLHRLQLERKRWIVVRKVPLNTFLIENSASGSTAWRNEASRVPLDLNGQAEFCSLRSAYLKVNVYQVGLPESYRRAQYGIETRGYFCVFLALFAMQGRARKMSGILWLLRVATYVSGHIRQASFRENVSMAPPRIGKN